MPSFTTSAVASASPAGPATRDAERSHSKAGLGLGLRSDILYTSLASKKSVGLGIYLDFETWDGVLVSPKTSNGSFSATYEQQLAQSLATRSRGTSHQYQLEDPLICNDINFAQSFEAALAPSRTASHDVGTSPTMMDECPMAPMLPSAATFSGVAPERIPSRLDTSCLVHENGCEYCTSPTTPDSPGRLPTIMESSLEYEHGSSCGTEGAGLGFNLEEWAGWTDIESVVGTASSAGKD